MTTRRDAQTKLRDVGLMGLHAAAVAPFVAITEAGGGALPLAGLLTRLAGIVLAGASLALALTGAGRFALDACLGPAAERRS